MKLGVMDIFRSFEVGAQVEFSMDRGRNNKSQAPSPGPFQTRTHFLAPEVGTTSWSYRNLEFSKQLPVSIITDRPRHGIRLKNLTQSDTSTEIDGVFLQEWVTLSFILCEMLL